MKKKWIITVLLMFVFFPILYVCCKSKSGEVVEEKSVPVKMAPVVKKEISIPVQASGRLFPKVQIKLSFKTGGKIIKINVSEGSEVKKDQLLASLDLSEIEAYHNQAKKGYLKARRDLERVKNLYEDKAATLEQYQNMTTAYEVAESNLKIAEFNLKHSRIVAPSNGKILKQLVEINEIIGPGMPVFVFGSTESRWVIKTGISERNIVKVSMKDKAGIIFDAYPDKNFQGEVSEISEAVDPRTGTYEVELTVNDDSLKLIAGFIAKVYIQPSHKKSYYLIPVDALVEGEGMDGFVFFAKDSRAKKVRIKIAYLFDHRVAVESGLEDVREVITSGSSYLNDGTKIRIVD